MCPYSSLHPHGATKEEEEEEEEVLDIMADILGASLWAGRRPTTGRIR